MDVGLRIEELCCPPDLHRHVRNPGLFVRADHKAANRVPQLDADFTLGMGNVPPTYGWNTRLAAAVHSAGIPENLLTELIDTSRQAFAGGFDVVATANAMTKTILHWLANPTDDGSFRDSPMVTWV